MGDQKTVLPVVFEPALTIMIVTLLFRKPVDQSGLEFYSLYFIDNILDLRTIRSDILNGGSTHLTGDQTEVLGTIPVVLHAHSHDIIPHLSGSATQQDTTIYEMTLHTFDGRM